MLARTDLPPVPIPGPKAPPLIGALGGVLRFFAEPVQQMVALHRAYGDVAAVADGNAALVCAFGVARPGSRARSARVRGTITELVDFRRGLLSSNGNEEEYGE
jgi:hypothetical protein